MQAPEYRNIKHAAAENAELPFNNNPLRRGDQYFPQCGTDQALPEYQDNLSQELGSVACRIPDHGFKGIPGLSFKG